LSVGFSLSFGDFLLLFTAVLPITTIWVTPTLGQVSVCSSRLCRTARLRTYLNNIPCFVCSRHYLYSAPFGHFLFPTLPTSGQFFYASPKKWPPDSITQRSTGRTGVNRILFLCFPMKNVRVHSRMASYDGVFSRQHS
jgi:hypothetical protein